MGLGLGLGIQFNSLGGMVSKILTWGKSIPARFWGTTTPEYWGGLDAQAEVHYNRVIADGGVVPAGLGGVNSFFQVVKGVYGTSDINTAISAAYDPHYLGYKLGAGSGTTLGQAAQTLYSVKGIFGGIGTGSAYWEGTGVSGNFVSTPDASANRITSDMEIVCYVNLPNYAPVGAEQQLVSKYGYSENNRCYSFGFLTSNNKLTFRASPDGLSAALTAVATANCTLTANTNGYLKVTYDQNNGSGQYEVKFFQSTDGINYTQIGSTVTGASIGNTFTGAAPLLIGSIGSLATNTGVVNGRILRTTISNSINGTPVVDFNANQYTGANTWTSTTGEVWTVNSTGAGLADVTQTTAASQPLLLAHTGENYWFQPGLISGNFVSTPNAAANQITGDIDIIAYISKKTNNCEIIAKENGGSDMAYILMTENSSILQFRYSISSAPTTQIIIADNQALPTNFDGWVRFTRIVSTGAYQFYSSTNPSNTSINSISWTNRGSGITNSGINLRTNNNAVRIGLSLGVGFANTLSIYRATIANSIGGTPVVDFNPSSYNPSTSQTEWSSATGEVWTINVGTATTGYKAALVTKSIVQGDGIDDTLIRSTLPSIQYFSQYVALNPLTIIPSGGEYYVDGGGARGLIYGNVGQVRAWNGSEIQFTGANDNRLNLYNANYNGVSSTAYKNNALNSSGNTGTNISNMISLFSNGSGGSFSNSIINTIVKSLTVDNTTVNTAMYNALRGFDNNAY